MNSFLCTWSTEFSLENITLCLLPSSRCSKLKDSDNGKPRMTLLNPKHPQFHIWRFWGIILLLLSACTPASQTTPATSTFETTATEIERAAAPTIPPQTPTPTALSGPSFTNPVYKNDFPDPHVIRVG